MSRIKPVLWAALVLLASGCTSFRDYVHNGFKVGPNYCRPAAPVGAQWIDAGNPKLRRDRDDLVQWWAVFNDPALNRLMVTAYRQNLPLREAAFRVLQARAERGIAVGGLFPQNQTASGGYHRVGNGGIPGGFFDQWNFGFNLAWELDVWGRLRRQIAAADATLDATVEDYDAVLVTLLGDVAANYVQIRTLQERIRLLEESVKTQGGVEAFVRARVGAGQAGTTVDLAQAISNVLQTEAAIPTLEAQLRQTNNQLCILLGIPPIDLLHDEAQAGDLFLGAGPVPRPVRDEVAAGIPADLLRRRPDVRRAERQAAAQAEQIGIAEADLYPAFSITGTINYQATRLSRLFTSEAFNGSVGPVFQWNLLNYGRIVNNVRFQDARFQELVVAYQNAVLTAEQETENGLVTFLEAQEAERRFQKSREALDTARRVAWERWQRGALPDFTQYALIEQNFIQQQDAWVQARGLIATGLIQVYRSLGGGWEIRCQPQYEAPVAAEPAPPPAVPAAAPPAPPAPAVPAAAAPSRRGLPLGTYPVEEAKPVDRADRPAAASKAQKLEPPDMPEEIDPGDDSP